MNKTLIFDVSPLLDATTGTNERFSFEGPPEFEGIPAKSSVKGKVEIMRIDEGVNARAEDIELKVEFKCSKCLKKFSQTVTVPVANRIFLLEPPKKIEDPNELFLIDKKKRKIDLTEGLRQEIILHFPLIPVCSMGCKGICAVCGSDKNKKDCRCQPEDTETHKPLSALKDLFKN